MGSIILLIVFMVAAGALAYGPPLGWRATKALPPRAKTDRTPRQG